METQARSRPVLQPVRTDHDQHSSYSMPSAYSGASPLYPPSVTAPAPTPVYPASSHAYELAMRAHERALLDRLDRLDQRGRRDSVHSPAAARSLSPISEQSLSARRASVASLPLPREPAPSPLSPAYAQYSRPQTLADQTREMLLDGMLDSLPRQPPPRIDDRRASLPSLTGASRRNSQQVRDDLQEWGRVYFGNPTNADCFVSAVALRRHSDSSSADEGAAAKESPADGSNRVTIRARVRPCALDRKAFLLRRTFDMDELRATIPDRPPSSVASRRLSNDLGSWSPERRRSAAAASVRQGPGIDRSHVRSINTVPIHLTYARAFFPVIAALLYSGHISKGDIVDLPMPFPEAWTRTVAHAYTGQGELTEPIRQNILPGATSADGNWPRSQLSAINQLLLSIVRCQRLPLMSTTLNRRPALTTTISAPAASVFRRPMDPAPAPLVFINGWPGVGKDTVAECLTLLLGKDKALLVDVRSVGRETTSTTASCTCFGGAGVRCAKHHRQHPRYFSWDDPDPGPFASSTSSYLPLSPPASRSASFSSGSTATTTSASSSTVTANNSAPVTEAPAPFAPAVQSLIIPPEFTWTATTLIPTTTPFLGAAPVPPSLTTRIPLARIPAPLTTGHTAPGTLTISPINTSPATATAAGATILTRPHNPSSPTTTTPCSRENLARLLSHPPANRHRIAVLSACAPDTPQGLAALATFEAAARGTGRRIVGVLLTRGEAAEQEMSAESKRSYLSETGPSTWDDESLLWTSSRGGSIGSMSSVSSGGSSSSNIIRRLSAPGQGPGSEPGGLQTIGEIEDRFARRQGLVMPIGPELTLDMAHMPAFEAALRIVEFVRGLDAMGEPGPCGHGG
ncbi:hypothetical protein VTJ49DRAFT_4538 [Mycothermus thermophilus]|uniref:Uncharacterized protein n=1 Tax=Humicola insolens TaxID=85995 RepID=A0ABR3V520_HUMIN